MLPNQRATQNRPRNTTKPTEGSPASLDKAGNVRTSTKPSQKIPPSSKRANQHVRLTQESRNHHQKHQQEGPVGGRRGATTLKTKVPLPTASEINSRRANPTNHQQAGKTRRPLKQTMQPRTREPQTKARQTTKTTEHKKTTRHAKHK